MGETLPGIARRLEERTFSELSWRKSLGESLSLIGESLSLIGESFLQVGESFLQVGESLSSFSKT